MAVQKVSVELFLQLASDYPVIDVRSPGEYKHAHIPGAYSLPLFDDEERKIVGTAYKQESRENAIKIGLDFFGKKMRKMVEEIEKVSEDGCKLSQEKNERDEELISKSKTVLVHCWRGGMRSAAVAWLLDLFGFKVYTLVGGYKGFRTWVLNQFEKDYPFQVVGGYTGSGKTGILNELKKRGEKVIDLEDLAHHKGSAFGSIGMPQQTSQEMFENRLAIALAACVTKSSHLNEMDSNDGINRNPSSPIWIEDESQRIGAVNIPMSLWKLLRAKPLVFLNIPFEERLEYIVSGYGKADKEKLVNAILRIQKRLGGLETKTAINFLVEDNLKESFRILLKYYDKCYKKGLHNRENPEALVTEIECDKVDEAGNALRVLESKIQKENA